MSRPASDIPSIAQITSKPIPTREFWSARVIDTYYFLQQAERDGVQWVYRLFWKWNADYQQVELKDSIYMIDSNGKRVRPRGISRNRYIGNVAAYSHWDDVTYTFGQDTKSPYYAARIGYQYRSTLTGLYLEQYGMDQNNTKFVNFMEKGMNFMLDDIWQRCDICDTRNCSGHIDCVVCGNTASQRNSYQMAVLAGTTNRELTKQRWFCGPCGESNNRVYDHEWQKCARCHLYAAPDWTFIEEWDHDLNECPNCVSLYVTVPCCNRRVRTDSTAGFMVAETGKCVSCSDRHHYSQWVEVEAWNHRPDLIFHPETPPDPKRPLYIGMELEMGWNSASGVPDPNRTLGWWRGSLPEDLFYAKRDGSVSNGFELVTHPFNPEWALDGGFPFEAFERLRRDYKVPETHKSCGTHIHMNKEAFTTAHLWKFLKLHHELHQFIKMIAGRGDGTYSSFSDSSMAVQKQKLLEIAKAKAKGVDQYNRYVAVNLRNEYTIELRYMRGGPWPEEIKKNIEWALIAYDFTREMTIEQAREGALWNSEYLHEYIKQHPRADAILTWIDKHKNDNWR